MGKEEEKVVDCLWWCGILWLGRRTRSEQNMGGKKGSEKKKKVNGDTVTILDQYRQR